VALPPLAPIPNLRRLLTPEEVLLYTVKFHPLRGWQYLLACLVSLGFSYVWPLFILPCIAFFVLWRIPFMTNEVAVTNDRLLLRTGMFKILLEAIPDEALLHWKLEQNAMDVALHSGRVIMRVRGESGPMREIVLDWVWHPMTLLEALQALQDEKFRDGNAAA
jgi:hypothetical protein